MRRILYATAFLSLFAAPALAQMQPPGSPSPPGQQMTALAYEQQRLSSEQLKIGIEKMMTEHRDETAALRKRVADLEASLAYGKACGAAPGCWTPVP